MKSYLAIVKDVLDHGISKHPYRVTEGRKLENGTVGLPNIVFSHDMAAGFPLLTTRRMPIKSIAVELEGFINGITSKKWYQERRCKFWDEWSNPMVTPNYMNDNCIPVHRESVTEQELLTGTLRKLKPEEVKEQKLKADDLGPVYGYQWRSFGQQYDPIRTEGEPKGVFKNPNHPRWFHSPPINGVPEGFDQLKYIVDTLKNNPTDRRMVCSAWNPNQMHMQALPACHDLWGVVVYGDTINLRWDQRSCDLYLGVPCNIASYALLLILLAKHAGLKPGNLTGMLADCHLYDNQIEVAEELVKREPTNLPSLEIPNNDGEVFDFWKWNHTQMKILDYNPQTKLSVNVVI